MADAPTSPRLDVLIDRACRHLTPAEATALRGSLAGTLRNATTAVEGLHQRAADAEDDRDRARRWAVHLENENRRLEEQLDYTFLHKKNQELHERAARAEQQLAAVRAECEQLQRETRGLNPHAMAGRRDAVARVLAALDAAGQPAPAGECGYVDGDRRCINRPGHDNPARIHGPWVAHQPERAREDGHTAATGATKTKDAPEVAETPTGRQAGARRIQFHTQADPPIVAEAIRDIRRYGPPPNRR